MSRILIGLLVTFVHFFTLVNVGTNVDYGAAFCGYFGLALVGALYASAGTFASSLTDNQVVSFIIAVFIVIVFWLMDKLLIFVPSGMAGLVQFLSVDYHLTSISRGVIDTRNLIYFGSVIGFFLFLTIQILEVRKWK